MKAGRRSSAGRALQLALSLAISAGLVAWTLRGQDLDAAFGAVRAVHAGPVALYLIVQLCILLVRILRWGLVIRPLVEVDWGRVARAFIVGTMAVIVLPLRLGEFARPLLLAGRRADPDDAARGFATLVMERVADGLAVVGLMAGALALADAPLEAGPRVEAARAAAGVVGVISDSVTEAMSVALVQRDTFINGDGLSMSVSQPLRTRSGKISASLQSGVDADGNPVMSNRSLSLVPAGRELMTELAYRAPLGRDRSVSAVLAVRQQPNHDATAPIDAMVALRFRQLF